MKTKKSRKPRLTPAQKDWLREVLVDWSAGDLIDELIKSMNERAIRGWKISYDEYKQMMKSDRDDCPEDN
jgi:hypothetical protein